MSSQKKRDIMERIRAAVTDVLSSEGIDAEQVEFIGDSSADDDVLNEVEMRAYAAEQGREKEFDTVLARFHRAEAAHRGNTKGANALLAIDRLQVGQPLRVLFDGRTDAVVHLIDTGDLDTLMAFLLEVGALVHLVPKLQKLLAKRLAARYTAEVTGRPVSKATRDRLDELANDSEFLHGLFGDKNVH